MGLLVQLHSSPTDVDGLSAKKWGAGPTGLALKQDGPWTYGGLFNHIWSFAGSDAVVNDVSSTFIQPFFNIYHTAISYFCFKTQKSTYDWENEQWTVPINFAVTKVVKMGNQVMSIGGGVTYWAEAPEKWT